jgi:sulfite reductase beta subunit-like hemoprotein
MGARLSRAAQPNEQSKKDDHPLNVPGTHREHLRQGGFASIDPNDLRGRFRWYGLYTQRRPASTAARPQPWSHGSSTMSTSCCAFASTAAP